MTSAEAARGILRRTCSSHRRTRTAAPANTRAGYWKARRRGLAAPVERRRPGGRRTCVAWSGQAAPTDADGLQVQVLRDETELEPCVARATSVLANICTSFPHPALGATRRDRAAERRHRHDDVGSAAPVGRVAAQRGTQRLTWLIDNLLESRADRCRSTRDSSPGRCVRRRRRSPRASSSTR